MAENVNKGIELRTAHDEVTLREQAMISPDEPKSNPQDVIVRSLTVAVAIILCVLIGVTANRYIREAHEREALLSGLPPHAAIALELAGVTPERITQTIGDLAVSADTHRADGVADGKPYTAAVDLDVSGLSDEQISALLGALALQGYAGFYRQPGHDHWPAANGPHIHAVYAGCVMKPLLKMQIHDWLHGRNGLRSHAKYGFFQPTEREKQIVSTLYNQYNPE